MWTIPQGTLFRVGIERHAGAAGDLYVLLRLASKTEVVVALSGFVVPIGRRGRAVPCLCPGCSDPLRVALPRTRPASPLSLREAEPETNIESRSSLRPDGCRRPAVPPLVPRRFALGAR